MRGTDDTDQVALRVEFSLRNDTGYSKDFVLAPIKVGGGFCSGGREWRNKMSGRDFFERFNLFHRRLQDFFRCFFF